MYRCRKICRYRQGDIQKCINRYRYRYIFRYIFRYRS